MLLNCCLIPKIIVILRPILYLEYLRQKQPDLFFVDLLEYLLSFLDGNVDEGSKTFSNSESSVSGCCLAFA